MNDDLKVTLFQSVPTDDATLQTFSMQCIAKTLNSGHAEIGFGSDNLRSHQFRPGNIALCPRNAEQWLRWKDPVRVLRVELPDSALRAAAEEFGEEKVEFCNTPYLTDGRVSALLTAVELEREAGYPSGRLYRDALGQAIASAVTQICGVLRRPAQQWKGGLSPSQLRRVSEYVQDRLTHELTLVELAGAVGLSRAHFSQMFRRSTGISPHKFVTNVRIARAKELLQKPELRMTDIAIVSGFQTSQHFARVFKIWCGTSPTQFRRSFS
jgi:AraC family transcriptional regulator